ncbi:MAG: putative metal-dependent hydrolase [Lachnospiraceae bacterium]|jgi:predicted metal-dependent hydrolase|nr:putative metal-dependent hydrolase [Lachnospiraceae bacterium]MDF2843444.1 putative metal-dependent hydrolase [Herbinix sp.]
MFSFQYGTSTIEYTLTRSERKNISISIEPNKNIKVKAPVELTDDEVMEVVKKKSRWITAKLFEMREIENRKYHRQYVNGESFTYMGRNYSLQLVDDITLKKPEVKLYRGKLYVKTPSRNEDVIHKAIVKWYQEKAKEKIPDRVSYYEKFFVEKHGRIDIKDQKKRWGSCTKEGDLAFNWKSIIAPANILDYIIVHELCHLRYMNHSKEFWEMLGRVLPDYESRKEWLMNNGMKLEV